MRKLILCIIKNKFYIISFFLILISCNNHTERKEKNNNLIKINSNEITELSSDKIRLFKMNVLLKGDDYSFGRLVEHYLLSENSAENILPFSIIMADKYNNSSGCYYTYLCLIFQYTNQLKSNNKIIDSLKEEDKLRIMYYLEKGAKLNNYACIYNLVDVYENGYGVEKNAIKLDSLNKVLNSVKLEVQHY